MASYFSLDGRRLRSSPDITNPSSGSSVSTSRTYTAMTQHGNKLYATPTNNATLYVATPPLESFPFAQVGSLNFQGLSSPEDICSHQGVIYYIKAFQSSTRLGAYNLATDTNNTPFTNDELGRIGTNEFMVSTGAPPQRPVRLASFGGSLYMITESTQANVRPGIYRFDDLTDNTAITRVTFLARNTDVSNAADYAVESFAEGSDILYFTSTASGVIRTFDVDLADSTSNVVTPPGFSRLTNEFTVTDEGSAVYPNALTRFRTTGLRGYVGSSEIAASYLGSTEIAAAYIGSTEL